MNTVDDATKNQARASHLDRMVSQILILGRARATLGALGSHCAREDSHLGNKAAEVIADVNAMIAEAVDGYLREWEN